MNEHLQPTTGVEAAGAGTRASVANLLVDSPMFARAWWSFRQREIGRGSADRRPRQEARAHRPGKAGWGREGAGSLPPFSFSLKVVLILLAFANFLGQTSAVSAAEWDLITIPRLQYGGGGDWYTDPTSIPNLLKAAGDRLRLPVRPEHLIIRITDADLYNAPMVYLTGHGNVKFADDEINRLVTYLDSGGFLWIDDCYGLDKSIRREIRRMYPDKELALIPVDHPIYHTAYDFPKGLPKIHEHDGKPPQGYGIFNKGRMVIFYTYETDIGDGIEDAGVHPEDSPEIRESALKMALNILVFAMTQ